MTKSPERITFKAIPMIQPMGEFFVGVIDYQDLRRISYADIRELDNELDTYIGIQRTLNPQRVTEIEKFVETVDAAFPTSIVLWLPGECFHFNAKKGEVELEETDGIPFDKMAKILDGQHRIEGLRSTKKPTFQLVVTILVEADIADQAYIFATVNLAQTKVNTSLVYDLLDYSESRSPQKTCHEIAVGLDEYKDSPFHKTIKRLGRSTPGRTDETLSQAVIVNALLPMISFDPIKDRDALKRGKSLRKSARRELTRAPFRNLFIDERDPYIAKLVLNYFIAVQNKWPKAWASRERGDMLPRTNGFRALMRLFKDCYLHLNIDLENPRALSVRDFSSVLERVNLSDDAFNTTNYPPGSAGEMKLYKELKEQASV